MEDDDDVYCRQFGRQPEMRQRRMRSMIETVASRVMMNIKEMVMMLGLRLELDEDEDEG